MPGKNCSAQVLVPGFGWARTMELLRAARWREGYSGLGPTAPRFGAEGALPRAPVHWVVPEVLPMRGRCSPVFPVPRLALESSLRLLHAKVGWNTLEVPRSYRQRASAHRGCFRPIASCVLGDPQE